MSPIISWFNNPHRRFPLLALIGAGFVLLLARNLGTYPGVFADEYYYNAFTRLTAAADAAIPSYLYYALFGATRACGDGFLECTRLLNGLLLIGAAPFIYLIARSLMPSTRAGVVTVLTVAAPFNVYTAYFMPETTYFFAFWVMSWLAMRAYAEPSLLRVALAGAALGLAALIKVHGLFLTPALAVFLVYIAYARRADLARHWLLNAVLYLAVALAVAVAVRFGVGYLSAGKAGLSLLGPFYGGAASAGRPMTDLILPALQNLRGHLLACLFLYALPVGAIVLGAANGAARRAAGPAALAMIVYTILMLGDLLSMTALFTASVVGNGAGETLERLHMRYYNFAFPLLLLVAGAALPADRQGASRRARLVIALALGAAVLYANFVLFRDFTPNFVDAPEVWSLKTPVLFHLATALTLATLACWVVSPPSAARAFLYLAAPVMMLSSAAALGALVRSNTNLDPYGRAGAFTRDHLDRAEIDQLSIVGSDHGAVFRAKYFLDNAQANMVILPEGKAFTVGDLARHKQWALVVGNHPPPPGAIAHNADRGFVLYKIERVDDLVLAVDFSKAELGLAEVEGVSGAEPWGRWSNGKQIVLTTAAPLPVRLRLHLTARTVGANIGLPFPVRVGDEQREARFGAENGGVVLDFTTDGRQRRIEIDVPHPILASTFGANPQDTRQIALALINMEVAQRRPAAPAPQSGVGQPVPER